MTLQLYKSNVALLFLPFFNVFGWMNNRSAKIIVCWRLVVCDSRSESESANFYRLQLRLRLWPKRSTPTDSNSGLDSDSAALVLTPNSIQHLTSWLYCIMHRRGCFEVPCRSCAVSLFATMSIAVHLNVKIAKGLPKMPLRPLARVQFSFYFYLTVEASHHRKM